jgi:hypothetical protein
MSAIDTTPHGGEIMQPPERRIPEPEPSESDRPVRGNPAADEAADEAAIEDRPSLPENPEPMPADAGNAESEPQVHDTGGLKSLKKQKG